MGVTVETEPCEPMKRGPEYLESGPDPSDGQIKSEKYRCRQAQRFIMEHKGNTAINWPT
jgi:hypothetical protein